MATISDVNTRIRTMLAASPITVRYPNETAVLSDQPEAFTVPVLHPAFSDIASFGGGRGANRYRRRHMLELVVMVPVGQGLEIALTYAEQLAAIFRSQRPTDDISFFDAHVDPEFTIDSDNGNYWRLSALCNLTFDQIG